MHVSDSVAVIIFFVISAASAVSINFRNFSATVKPSQQSIQSHLDRLSVGNPHIQQQHEVTVTLSPTTPALSKVTDPADLPKSNLCHVTVHKRLRHTWLEAFRACKELGNGTELVSINSEEDYNVLNAKIKEARSPVSVVYWTSGTDVIDEGVYMWMADGLQVNVPDAVWSAGQPDNLWETEHCLALRRSVQERKYQLSDENCLVSGAFICAQRC